MIDRRTLIGFAGLLSVPALAAETSAANQWFPLTGDKGQPVPNLRVPVELAEDIDELRGAVWGGPASASVKLIQFYDYNCPWCRAAEGDLAQLLRGDQDLRIGLVNNPILSPASAQAAKVELAVLNLKGAAAAHALHERLFGTPGRIDGVRALDAAASLGAARTEVEPLADGPEVRAMLGRQMRLAASIGLVATPSYVVGGAAILGYPGPTTLKRVVANARLCGTVAC